MPYGVMADAVVVLHLAFLAFLGLGSLLVWRWPRAALVHAPALAWGAVMIGIGFDCPLTAIEKQWRETAGERSYDGGFVDRYVENVVYPDHLTPLLWILVASISVVTYGRLLTWAAARRHGPGAAPLPTSGRRVPPR